MKTLLGTIFALILTVFCSMAQAESFEEDLDQLNQFLASGQFDAVLKSARQIVKASEAAADSSSLAKALIFESEAQYYLGQHEATLPPLERALVIYEAIGDLAGIGRTLYSISYYYNRIDPNTMISYLERGLKFANQAADTTLQMNIANAMGTAHWHLGNYDQAIDAYKSSGELARKTDNTSALASSQQNIGMVHIHLGENRSALEYLTRALEALTAAERNHGIAVTLGNMGNAHLSLRDYESALSCYEKSLALHKTNGHLRGQGIQLANISSIHQAMDEPEKALVLEQEAYDIAVAADDLRSIVRTQSSLGRIHMSLGNETDAEANLRSALKNAETFGDSYLLLRTEKALAQLAADRGDTSEAFSWFSTAEKRAVEINDSYSIGNIKADRALLHAQAGRLDLAVSDIKAAIDLHARTHSRNSTHNWHFQLAQFYNQLGNELETRQQFEASLACISDLDALIAMDRFRVHLFNEVADIVNAYSAWLGRRGEAQKGLETLDWGRARELTLRVLQETPVSAFSSAELAALDKLSAFQQKIREEALTEEERLEIMAEIDLAEAEYDKARREGSVLPKLQNHFDFVWPSPDIMAIEYAVCQDTLLVFSCYKNEVSFRQIPQANNLMDRVRAFSSLVANPTSNQTSDLASASLFKILLAPELQNSTHTELIIVPCGHLWGLPFSALLSDSNTYLSDNTVLSYVPSLQSLAGLQASPVQPFNRILALANGEFSETQDSHSPLTRLDSVTDEANQIGRLSSETTVLLEPDEALIKSLPLGQYQLIHWATHTIVDQDNPSRSSIIVGPSDREDGYLQVREIYRLPLNARLVVVSGCGSGDGTVVPGEGLMGMSHALLSAGAKSTLLSRWDISDEGAAAFMTEYYKAAQHYPVAKALQHTQKTLRKTDKWDHPAVWAAFFVAGDGSQQVELPTISIWKNYKVFAVILAFILIALFLLNRLRSNYPK